MTLAFPKPPSRATVTRARQRRQRKARAACLDVVWTRAGGCCEVCGQPVRRLADAVSTLWIGHVHETPPRSLGGDPTDPSGCTLLCPRCHAEAHRLAVVGSTLTRPKRAGS